MREVWPRSLEQVNLVEPSKEMQRAAQTLLQGKLIPSAFPLLITIFNICCKGNLHLNGLKSSKIKFFLRIACAYTERWKKFNLWLGMNNFSFKGQIALEPQLVEEDFIVEFAA